MKKENGVDNMTESSTNLSLKVLNDTRFSSRYESLRSVHQHFHQVLETLEEIEINDGRSGGDAHSLLLCIKNFDFVFGLNIMKNVFEKTNILSKYIQNQDVSIHEVVDVADRTITSISNLCNENIFEEIWIETEKFCRKKNGIEEPVMPCKRKVPKEFGGGDFHPSEINSPRDFFLKTSYYPFLDGIVEHIKSRLGKNQLSLLCDMETVLVASFNRDSIPKEAFKKACIAVQEAYGIETDSLSAEIDLFIF